MGKRTKTRKYIFSVIAFASILLVLTFAVFKIDNSTNEMIVEYVSNLGWEIEDSPEEISRFKIPEIFDEIFEEYNSLQKESGFDLSEYKGKSVLRYSYVIKNHKESQNKTILINIIVLEKRIIGGDVSSKGINVSFPFQAPLSCTPTIR